ncbi:MAG: YIP1 family protein [candidate division Zixibacteria bacterium]|nr:YIP1 family protein [candidate division Zixibacteria bacterium]
MKMPLSIRGIKDVFWNPRSFFDELGDEPKIWPSIIIPYMILLAFLFFWYYTVVEVIAMRQVASGNLSPVYLEYISRFGTDSLIGAIKKQHLIWYGGWVLFKPLVMAAIGYFFGKLINKGFRYSLALALILYGELVFRLSDIISSLIIILKITPNVTLSLGALLAPAITNPALNNLLLLSNPFLIWEVVVVAIGFSAVLHCSRRRAVQLSILSVCTLLFLKIFISLWSS